MSGGQGKLVRSFYRMVIRAARKHDSHPALKGILATQRNQRYDHENQVWMNWEANDGSQEAAVAASYFKELSRGGVFYLPEVSATRIARSAFRRPYDSSEDVDMHLDAATKTIRTLEQNLAKGREMGVLEMDVSDSEHRKFDLVPYKSPQAACLLLAHPLLQQSALTRSVILIVQHSESSSFGLVVNRRIPLTIGDLIDRYEEDTTGELSSRVRDGLSAFRDNVVFKGGDVSLEFLSILHPYGQLQGAEKVANGLYWKCDLNQAKELVERGEIESKNFKFLLGHAR